MALCKEHASHDLSYNGFQNQLSKYLHKVCHLTIASKTNFKYLHDTCYLKIAFKTNSLSIFMKHTIVPQLTKYLHKTCYLTIASKTNFTYLHETRHLTPTLSIYMKHAILQ